MNWRKRIELLFKINIIFKDSTKRRVDRFSFWEIRVIFSINFQYLNILDFLKNQVSNERIFRKKGEITNCNDFEKKFQWIVNERDLEIWLDHRRSRVPLNNSVKDQQNKNEKLGEQSRVRSS